MILLSFVTEFRRVYIDLEWQCMQPVPYNPV